MAIINRVLFRQFAQMQKRQGTRAVAAYIANAINYRVINTTFRGSHSQKGEDLLIDALFKHKKKGFYIDIGACHPKRLSNTKFFYDRGWNGINIEPNPQRLPLFMQDRPRDINLNIGIGSVSKEMLFYVFEAASGSTFSKEEAETLVKVGYRLKKKLFVPVMKLSDVMKKHVKGPIDFMTVDTEGLDMDVLKSNDWEKFRPKLLCIETIDFIDLLVLDGTSDRKEVISKYLKNCGYREYHSNGLNTIYKDVRK